MPYPEELKSLFDELDQAIEGHKMKRREARLKRRQDLIHIRAEKNLRKKELSHLAYEEELKLGQLQTKLRNLKRNARNAAPDLEIRVNGTIAEVKRDIQKIESQVKED